MPTPLWIVLVLGGCVAVLIQLVMADPRERPLIQCGMIAGVAVIVASGLLMIDFLDHPYRDRTGSIQPTEMRETLKMTAHMQPGLQVPCRTDGRSLAV